MAYTLQKTSDGQYKCPYCSETWPTPVTNRVIRERPLDQDAKKHANNAVESCPHLREEGSPGTRRVTMERHDYPCRRKWVDAYLSFHKEDPVPDKEPDDPVTPCPDRGDLYLTVLLESGRKPVAGANVEITGPQTRKGTTDKHGKSYFHRIKPGSYTVKVSKSGHVEKSTTGTVQVNQRTNVYLLLEKTKKVPVRWIEKTLEYHSGMHGKIVTKTKIIIREKYKEVPESWVEYGKEWEEPERGDIPGGDVYYIRRYTAVFKTPDGMYYSEKIGGVLMTIAKIFLGGLEGEAEFVYESWDEYRKKRGRDSSDPLDKYGP
jgi:hypothetical protein